MTIPGLWINSKFGAVNRFVEKYLIENVRAVGSEIDFLVVHPFPPVRGILISHLKRCDALISIPGAVVTRHDGYAVDPLGLNGLHLVPHAYTIAICSPSMPI